MDFNNDLIKIIVLILAAFRFSLFIAIDDGLFDVFEKLRAISGVKRDENGIAYGSNMFSRGMLCMWCNSVWIGIILTAITIFINPNQSRYFYGVLLPFALSGAVVGLKGDSY